MNLKKIALSSQQFSILLANAIIHFDNALYTYLVPIIAPIFFPQKTLIMQMVWGYGILITSVFAKPLGVIFFSKMAQTKKENTTLRTTLLGVSMSLTAIGLLPVHETANIYGVVGLILSRTCCEVFAAGENAIAKLYLIKNIPNTLAKKLSSWYEISTMLGILLAGGIGTLFASLYQAISYWRIPFITASACTWLTLIFLRIKEEDIPTRTLDVDKNFSIAAQLWKNRTPIIRIMMITGLSYITYSIPFVFMNSFVPMVTNLSYATMMHYNTTLMLFDLLLLFVVGKILPKYDHNNIMAVTSSLIGCSIIPLFLGLKGASMLYVTLLRCWLFVLGVIFCHAVTLWCKEQIPANNNYLTIGFATVLGSSLLGKSAPAICFALFDWSHRPLLPACYIALLAFIATLIMATSASE